MATTSRSHWHSARIVAPWTEVDVAAVAGDGVEEVIVEVDHPGEVEWEEIWDAAAVEIEETCRNEKAIGFVPRAATRTFHGAMSATVARNRKLVGEEVVVVVMEEIAEVTVGVEEEEEDTVADAVEDGTLDRCEEGKLRNFVQLVDLAKSKDNN